MKKDDIPNRTRPLTAPAVGTPIVLMDGSDGKVEQIIGPGLVGDFMLHVDTVPFPIEARLDRTLDRWVEAR